MLKKLSLRNFKKHTALDVDFTPGVNGIFGPNYRGKSTILHGIMFCLGGATALPRGMSVETDGATGKFKQMLQFEAAGVDYLVVRSKTEAKLYKGHAEDKESLLAAGNTAVNARIEAILGVDLKTFKSLRYAEQKKTDSILTLGVAKLHAIVDKITGVDDVNQAITKLTGIQQAQAAVVDSLPEVDLTYLEGDVAQLAVGLDRLEEDLTAANEDAGRAATIRETAQRTHERAQAEVRRLEGEISAAKSARAEWDTAEAQLLTATELLESAQLGLPEKTDDIPDDDSASLAAVRDGLEEERRKAASVSSARFTLTADLAKLENSAKAREEALAEAIKQVPADYRPEDVAAASEAMLEAQKARVEAAQRVKSLREAVEAGKCSSCGRAFDDCADSVELQAAELVEAEQANAKAEADLAACRGVATAVTALKTAWEKAEQAVNLAVAKQQEVNESIEATRRRLDGLAVVRDDESIASELAEVSDRLHKRLSYENALKAAEKAVDKAKAHLDRMAAALNALPAPVQDLTALQADLEVATLTLGAAARDMDEINVVYDKCRSEKEQLQVKVAEARGRLQRAEDALSRAMADDLKRREAMGLLATAKALLKFLRDNRDRYVAGTWDRFSAVASQFCSACTEGAIEAISRDADGDFSYVEDGKRRSIEDASGAQKAVMGLAVQFALATSAPCPLDIIIVDEPTADMDPERSLATTMMLSTAGSQVIMISHSQMDNSVCENTIAL